MNPKHLPCWLPVAQGYVSIAYCLVGTPNNQTLHRQHNNDDTLCFPAWKPPLPVLVHNVVRIAQARVFNYLFLIKVV